MPILFIIIFSLLAYGEFRLVMAVFDALSARYDTASAIILILISFFIGISIGARLIKSQLKNLMGSLRSGQNPGKSATRSVLWVIAGALLIVPGYLSDVVALILLFPVTGWVVSKLFARFLEKLMRSSKFQFYGNVGNAGGFARGSAGTSPRTSPFRDARADVIDVEVVETRKGLSDNRPV